MKSIKSQYVHFDSSKVIIFSPSEEHRCWVSMPLQLRRDVENELVLTTPYHNIVLQIDMILREL